MTDISHPSYNAANNDHKDNGKTLGEDNVQEEPGKKREMTYGESILDRRPRAVQDLERVMLRQMRLQYKIIGKIGEGTFSSVFKAVDIDHVRYNNPWLHTTTSQPFYVRDARHNPTHLYLYQYVAIKKIYATSSPARIENEIEMLQQLDGKCNVAPLIEAARDYGEVVVVMPYFEHQDFRVYMHAMTPDDHKLYIKSLFVALAHVHSLGIVHRDIKPSNFLWHWKQKRGMLVDFGLAQRMDELKHEDEAYYDDNCENSPKRKRQLTIGTSNNASKQQSKQRPGYYSKDLRPGFKAPRAGTRGFRGPEVLLKTNRQTTALDIWSAGVMILCLFTRMFPFFNSTDDQDALIEIACLFGQREMEQVVRKYGRVWKCNLDSIPQSRLGWRQLITHFNPVLTESIGQDAEVAYDFLDKCLTMYAADRMTAADALKHPFLRSEVVEQ